MFKFLYNILYTTLFIPVFLLLTKKKGYPLLLKDRFVLYKNNREKNYIWFHCASVGELKVAEPLIKHLQKKGNKILITFFSPRAVSFAKENFPEAEIRALPFDLPFLIKKFIKIHQPKALYIVEEEFWLNLITKSNKNGIPVVSINTRLSEKNLKFYKRLWFIYKDIFNSIKKFLVRSEEDLKLLKNLVPMEKLKLCGDLKFLAPQTAKEIKLSIKRNPIIILGSTHNPEEKIFLDILPKLKKAFPNIAYIIAPRHLERVEEIENLIKERGFSYKKRSESNVVDTDVYILDTIGELKGAYKYGDLVFVGGTIADVGGHNVLEPACLGKKVLVGKNIYKIKSNANLLRKLGILFFIEDINSLDRKIINLLKKDISPETIISKLKKLSKNIAKCYLKELK